MIARLRWELLPHRIFSVRLLLPRALFRNVRLSNLEKRRIHNMRITKVDWNLDLISLPTVVAVIGIYVSPSTLFESADLIGEVGANLVGEVGVGSVEDRGKSRGDCLNICLVESWRWRCHLEGKETGSLALIPTDAGGNTWNGSTNVKPEKDK